MIRGAVFCFCALLLVSCRSSSTSLRPVRVAVTRSSFLYLPLYMAGPLGYFEREGLTVALEETAGVSKTMQSVLGGSADIGTGGYLQVVQMATQRQALQALCVTQRHPGFVVLVSPRASRPIARLEDLRGAKIGVSTLGSDHERLLNRMLRQRGISAVEVQYVTIGTAAAHVAALERGIVDVGLSAPNSMLMMRRRHPGVLTLAAFHSDADLQQNLGFSDCAQSVVYAQRSWSDANRDVARRFVRAVMSASQWIRQRSPEEVRAKLPATLRTEDAELDAAAVRLAGSMLSPDGVMRPAAVEAAHQVLLPEISEVDMSKTFTNDFVEGQ